MSTKAPQRIESDSNYPSHSALRAESLHKTLQQIRRRLSPSERLVSRFIHGSVTGSAVSLVAATLGRPSGLLGGGLVALVGSSALLILVGQYGYTYNSGLLVLFFVIGFCAGITIEAVIRAARSRR